MGRGGTGKRCADAGGYVLIDASGFFTRRDLARTILGTKAAIC